MSPFALLFICVSLTLAKDGGHHGGHKVGPDFGGHILDHGGHHGGHGGGHHGGHIGGHDGFHHGGHHGGGHTAVHVEGGHHGHHGHHEHHHYDDHYEPPHYSYGYNVYGGTPYEARFDKLELENDDDNPNHRFDKSETRTEGLTTGGYSVDLPDGRTQVPFCKSMSAPTGALYVLREVVIRQICNGTEYTAPVGANKGNNTCRSASTSFKLAFAIFPIKNANLLSSF